jgi:hypothetical protein
MTFGYRIPPLLADRNAAAASIFLGQGAGMAGLRITPYISLLQRAESA